MSEPSELARAGLEPIHRSGKPSASNSFCESARELILLVSSSRGGSSFLAESFRHCPGYLHLRGEINPFLRLCRLAHPHSKTRSDALFAEHADSSSDLDQLLRADFGQPEGELHDHESMSRFARDWHRRLQLQWPQLEIALQTVEMALEETWRNRSESGQTSVAGGEDLEALQWRFLVQLRQSHPEIDPSFYDLRQGPGAAAREPHRPAGFPGPDLLEEPPFIAPVPWTVAGHPNSPLVIKTPSNAYRLEFLRALFPNARLRLLHLTRNPAASINGLYDGWRHWGFHSHDVGPTLAIQDYTDHVAGGGERWWKFDLPPGWESWTQRPLFEVCAFQWRSAHRAILEFSRRNDVDRLQVRFEDLIRGGTYRRSTLRRIANWLPVDPDALMGAVARQQRPIMSTEPPRPKRWLARAERLAPVLEHRETREITETLGYAADRQDWF